MLMLISLFTGLVLAYLAYVVAGVESGRLKLPRGQMMIQGTLGFASALVAFMLGSVTQGPGRSASFDAGFGYHVLELVTIMMVLGVMALSGVSIHYATSKDGSGG